MVDNCFIVKSELHGEVANVQFFYNPVKPMSDFVNEYIDHLSSLLSYGEVVSLEFYELVYSESVKGGGKE